MKDARRSATRCIIIQKMKLPGRLKIWKRAALLALWIVAPVVLGVIAATLDGEHGSVVFVVVGLYVGIAGAFSYLLLPLVSQFERLGIVGQVGISTIAAAMPITVLFAYDSFAPHTYHITSGARASYLALMSGTALVFALIGATVVAAVRYRWSNQSSD